MTDDKDTTDAVETLGRRAALELESMTMRFFTWVDLEAARLGVTKDADVLDALKLYCGFDMPDAYEVWLDEAD